MAKTLEDVLKDPLSATEEDFAQLTGGEIENVEETKAETDSAPASATDEVVNKQESSDEKQDQNAESKPGLEKENISADGAGTQDQQTAEPVIVAKDGKSTIPHFVLKSERERRAAAERSVRELSEKVAQLQGQLESGKTEPTAATEDIVDSDILDSLEEEAPSVAKLMRGLMGQVKKLEEQLQQAGQVINEVQSERATQAELTVDEAIDQVPKLAFLRDSDQDKFNAVADIDQFLRNSPQFKFDSLTQRFEKAVAMYEAANGEIAIPGSAKQEKPSLTAEEAKAKADAALAKAAKAAVPQTLTDIPGGTPPSISDKEAVEAMSSAQLTAKLMSMTPEQQEAYLARLF